MHSLPLFHRIAGERVVVVGDGEMAAAKRRLIERAGGVCCGEAEQARLGFVAVEDGEEAEAAAIRLKARGLLVNVADRPELCDFTLPSVLERGDVLVAVSTGGASAGLAKQLRLRLEALLPSSLGALARGLSEARDALRSRWPDAAQRRRAIDSALAQGGPLDPLKDESQARIDAWLREPDKGAPAQTIEIVIASDDPDDLTLRQARLLGEADVVLHGRDIAPAILNRMRADAVRGALDAAGQARPGLTLILRR
jgi:uroporphyrin-III C-methyltransferase/precorrin-2 dehydrogenase/sirohydrochlorin ferrochelatase